MTVGLLTLNLALFGAHSLKDKRRVIQAVKQRIRNRFNVSVAEVDDANSARHCRLAVASVSSDSRSVHARLDKIVELVRAFHDVTLLDYSREML